MKYSKQSWISDTESNPSGNSNVSFHLGADILNLFLCFYTCFLLLWDFYIFPCVVDAKIW